MPAPAPDPGRSHLVVGLTGGIASGKSTVARRLAELGAAVVDADVLAREVVAPGSAGLAEVADAFPGVLAPDGSLDRAALGRIVFADPAALRRLEAVTHPRIAALRARREAEAVAAGARVVVQDVPLLVEKGLADEVDLVLGGHSTGGLVATLWADRHPGALRALVLNSPWLELVSMQVITKLSAAALAGLARRAPRTRIPVKDPGIYTRTLSGWLDSDGPRPAQTEGDPFYDGWDLDPRWRRAPADIYAGWIAAVTEGHAAVAKGLDISCPVFVLTGSRRSRVLSSSVDPRAADIVLDVEGMRRRAMDLGDRVSVISVEGAIHDVLASARPARERAFRELSRWLRVYVPR